jgi:hypothetical protein
MLSTWLRGTGGVLEIVGVLTIVLEFRGIRRLYPKEGRGFLGRWWDRLRRRNRAHHVFITDEAGATDEISGIETWNDSWGDARKIEELRDRIARLQKRADDDRLQADRGRQEVADELAAARDEIRSLDGKVGELTKGSILIRGWGVLPLVLGIVLTTWPTEIAGWFGAS